MSTKHALLTLAATSALLSGCIARKVVPVGSETAIEKIYVLHNKKVHMEEFIHELVSQLEQLGFQTGVYSGDRPADAKHYLIYTANWNWDVAMYLTYFRATLYENEQVLGEVEYDARKGGANMGKFGRAAEKIRPLLRDLLKNVRRGTTVSVNSRSLVSPSSG